MTISMLVILHRNTKKWIIGERVSRETYDRLKDADGSLYVMICYEAGEPKIIVLKREIWEHAERTFDNL
jgi:diphthamide synthase (EF-2-diphthine--ammonia ligase)